MRRSRSGIVTALCAAALALSAAPASAAPPADPLFVLDIAAVRAAAPKSPPPRLPADFEGPCGVAVDSSGAFYVSDYYHHVIDVFRPNAPLQFPLAYPAFPGYLTQIQNVDPLDGPCGLAVGSSGEVFVNNFHRNVERFIPSGFPPSAGSPPAVPATKYFAAGIFESAPSTGVALGPDGETLYANVRTQINAYALSGVSLGTIATGSLQDAYGLAVSGFPATAGYLYVPDAATDTVKVFDPAAAVPDVPVQVIDGNELPGGGFGSLRDSAIAVDNATGTIYVADTQGPQLSESPKATVHAFDPAGTYLGRLKHDVIDGSPVGLAVDNSPTATQGRVYLTSGNSEDSVLYAYPPGAAGFPPVTLMLSEGGGGALGAGVEAALEPGSPPSSLAKRSGASTSAIAQKGTLRVTVNGRLAPKRLPRSGAAPIAVTVGGRVSTTDQSPPPALKTLRVEINRNGRLDSTGLPICPYDAIQPASTQRALSACRSSLVGQGSFEAEITLSGQEPYPAKGKLLLFNGRKGGKPVLFGQIYSPRPFATSFVIVFAIKKLGGGTFGTALQAQLPASFSAWGNLTAIEMTLQRRYAFKGKARSYVSAGCPAPKGFSSVPFSLARTTFGFAGGKKLASVLSSSCKIRR